MSQVAIMQPYIFPYIGYFRLINYADKFIFLNDVNFIKSGWINRNKLIFNNKECYFSVPLQNASQNELINNIKVCPANFDKWKNKFLLSFTSFYKKFYYYHEALRIIENTLSNNSEYISDIAIKSIKECCNYLDINTKLITTSSIYEKHTKGEERILSICKKENAQKYLNLPNGKNIYTVENFKKNGLEIAFLDIESDILPQCMGESIEYNPFISILDLIARFSKDDIKTILSTKQKNLMP